MTGLFLAIRSLAESPARTILTALGVMISSIAIILLISIGLGVQRDIEGQVEELGVNVLVVLPGRMDLGGFGFNPNMAGQSFLAAEDARTLDEVEGVRRTSLMTFIGGGITQDDKESYPLMLAAEPDWFRMRPEDIREGRVFDESDKGEKVVVLGSIAAEELFGEASAIGEEVEIDGDIYSVVGVTQSAEDEGSVFSMQSFSNTAHVPFSTWVADHPETQIDRIMVQSYPDAEPRALVDRMEASLAQRLDRPQFSVITQEDLLGLIYSVMGILSTLVVGLASIGLFVGGMGILAVMMMSVSERQAEFGVLKAVGARQGDIFRQMLWESMLVGLVGSAAGLVVSLIAAGILGATTSIKPVVTWWIVAIAFGVGMGVGAAAGALPARRAARLDPVECLRRE